MSSLIVLLDVGTPEASSRNDVASSTECDRASLKYFAPKIV